MLFSRPISNCGLSPTRRQFFRTGKCLPHQGGPLADGVIGAGMVVCPLHAHRFRLADGSGVDTDLCARSFPLEIRDGFVFLRLWRTREVADPKGLANL